jgi:hypothetical protein
MFSRSSLAAPHEIGKNIAEGLAVWHNYHENM